MYTYQRPPKRPDELNRHHQSIRQQRHHKRMRNWAIFGIIILLLAIIFPKYFEALFFYSLDGLFVPIGVISYLIIAEMWFGRRY